MADTWSKAFPCTAFNNVSALRPGSLSMLSITTWFICGGCGASGLHLKLPKSNDWIFFPLFFWIWSQKFGVEKSWMVIFKGVFFYLPSWLGFRYSVATHPRMSENLRYAQSTLRLYYQHVPYELLTIWAKKCFRVTLIS